jgi:hypothetical protein
MYGPPAVGKMTVGQVLADATGYRFLYNHLTVPAAKAIFPCAGPEFDPRYIALLNTFRLAGITAAADAQVDLIVTLAYSGAVDDPFIAAIVEAVESRGSTIHFVELTAPDSVLAARVGNPSREQANKLTDPARLRRMLDARDVRASVNHPNIIKLDTSMLPPADAARRIIDAIES